tara:strand:+ start:45 stop:1022 length:978 start_codon:yes stop_codon:yes gene_type:complete
MQNVLIVGGAGYIGSNLIVDLISNYNVTIIDECIYDNIPKTYINNKNTETPYFLKSSISKINKNYLKNFDVIVLLSGYVGDPITKKYPNISKLNNENYIKSFLKKISTKTKLIFISTCSNYGIINKDTVADEKFDLKPISNYSKSKVKIEKFILKNLPNLNYTILRFATAYGLSPRMRFDLTINGFTHELFFKKKLIAYDIDTWRPYCHVKDFSLAINLVIKKQTESYQQIYNVGSNHNNYSKEQIIEKIQNKINFKTKVILKKNDIDRRNYIVSFDKIKKSIGFKSRYNLDYGINELLLVFNKGYFNYDVMNYPFHNNQQLKIF